MEVEFPAAGLKLPAKPGRSTKNVLKHSGALYYDPPKPLGTSVPVGFLLLESISQMNVTTTESLNN